MRVMATTAAETELARELRVYVESRLAHHELSLMDGVGALQIVQTWMVSKVLGALQQTQTGGIAVPPPGSVRPKRNE